MKVCDFTKSNYPPWVFFTFIKSCKWHQIVQSIQYVVSFTEIGIFHCTYMINVLKGQNIKLQNILTMRIYYFIIWKFEDNYFHHMLFWKIRNTQSVTSNAGFSCPTTLFRVLMLFLLFYTFFSFEFF